MKLNTRIKLFVLVLLTITANSISAQDKQSPKNATQMKSLGEQLDERAQWAQQNFSKEVKDIYANGVESVIASGIYERVLKVGDKAPNFTLKNQMGKELALYDMLKETPVILTWYRGGWCPYCNLTLHALQDNLDEFKKAGANLLALTPELPDNSMSTAEKNELEFSILSDLDNKVAREYGLVFKLAPDVAKIYDAKFDLKSYNGNNSDELPLAATYVINKDGVISYAFIDADYTKRAEPSEIIKAIEAIK